MKTTIVDIHKKNGIRPEFDVYCGRIIGRHNEHTEDLKEYWERGSIWQNPFSMKKYKERCLPMYEFYIRRRLINFPDKYVLSTLKGKRLGGWCITTDKVEMDIEKMVCHIQVLIKLIEEGL